MQKQHNTFQYTTLSFLRISMSFIFLWAFFDKLLGLGFSTQPDKSWLAGSSPTTGFLLHGTQGPLAEVFANMANNAVVDWLYMLGLLGVGTALLLGIGMRVATVSGSTMMALFYLAAMPPTHNPIVDEHIIYILVLTSFSFVKPDQWMGLGEWWHSLSVVKRHPILG